MTTSLLSVSGIKMSKTAKYNIVFFKSWKFLDFSRFSLFFKHIKNHIKSSPNQFQRFFKILTVGISQLEYTNCGLAVVRRFLSVLLFCKSTNFEFVIRPRPSMKSIWSDKLATKESRILTRVLSSTFITFTTSLSSSTETVSTVTARL